MLIVVGTVDEILQGPSIKKLGIEFIAKMRLDVVEQAEELIDAQCNHTDWHNKNEYVNVSREDNWFKYVE